MVTIEQLRSGCEEFAQSLADQLNLVTREFTYPRNFSKLVWRCILQKAYDYFVVILELTKSGRSWAASPLLRPMCEDLFYLCFLQTLDTADADEFTMLTAQREVLEGLRVDAKADDPTAWVGTASNWDGPNKVTLETVVCRLSALKARMGHRCWKSGKDKPKAVEAALAVEGGERLYQVLYYGTSKHVHFSPHQLFRMMGCGHNGRGSVRRNPIFERYDAAYSLSTAAWILLLVIDACRQEGFNPENSPGCCPERLVGLLQAFERPPLIPHFEVQDGSLDTVPHPLKPQRPDRNEDSGPPT